MLMSLLAVAIQAATLQPVSQTATAITGPLRITDDSITFGKRRVKAQKVATTAAFWEAGDKKVSATVYQLANDPGALLGGNRLCGARDPARFVVVWRSVEPWGTTVTLAVWTSAKAPTSGKTPGMCATYSYE